MAVCFPDYLPSARLRLRRLHRDDSPALHAYRILPEVARYQYWESFTPEDAVRLVESQLRAECDVPGTWFQLAIVHAATDTVIGDCGLHCRKEDPRQMEIGITLAPRYQGRRYADEAIECLLGFVFRVLDKHRVFATVDVLNLPAIALCRRMGFRQEGHFVENLWFKRAWSSEFVFAMLQREWDERTQLFPIPKLPNQSPPPSGLPDRG